MKHSLALCLIPIFLLAMIPALMGDRKVRDQGNSNHEIRLHELDRRQAEDMRKSWTDLLSQRSKDHYIKAFLKGSIAPGGYELIRLKAHGTLLNLTFQNLEDDDETRAIMIRARDVTRLEVLKRPW